MDRKQAEIRINELKLVLIEASRKYYVDNAPIMSDFDFDYENERREITTEEFEFNESVKELYDDLTNERNEEEW